MYGAQQKIFDTLSEKVNESCGKSDCQWIDKGFGYQCHFYLDILLNPVFVEYGRWTFLQYIIKINHERYSQILFLSFL